MEKRKVLTLVWCEVEDNIKGNLLIVEDEKVFGTKEFEQYIREELGYLVDIKHEEDEGFIEDFNNAVRLLSIGVSANYLDYDLGYEETTMVC